MNARTALAMCLTLVVLGCGRAPPPVVVLGPDSNHPMATGVSHVDLAAADSKPGVAVAVLVDISPSMSQQVRDRAGHKRPKNEIAREALAGIIEHTAQSKAAKPGLPLQMGIACFSSQARDLLPIAEFDADKAREALDRLPPPNSGTAIGRALEHGFKMLYGTGAARKYLVVITDGENTVGVQPDRMAKQLFNQTKGDVEIHFVAFDTKAGHFRFLKDVNGHVVQADDGRQLQDELTKIYDKRILAEKPEP